MMVFSADANSASSFHCQPLKPFSTTPSRQGSARAEHRQTGGHALEVGQALGLALGGADEDIAHAVPPGYLIGLDHAHKADTVGQLQLLCQCFQVRPGGAVAHKHQPRAVLLRLRSQQTHQLGVVLLGSQTAQREQDGIPFRMPSSARSGPFLRRCPAPGQRRSVNAVAL